MAKELEFFLYYDLKYVSLCSSALLHFFIPDLADAEAAETTEVVVVETASNEVVRGVSFEEAIGLPN